MNNIKNKFLITESQKIWLSVLGVIACLYCFLCGINGLSGAIKSMAQPNQIVLNDMIQIKDSKGKKVWVQVSEIDDSKYIYKSEVPKIASEQSCIDNGYIWDKDVCYSSNHVIKNDIKMVASSIFIKATSSSFIALFIGVFATVLFQSSSTTTSLIVGMTGSGIIGLGSAISMIMGANIGTTVTNTLVSLGHLRAGAEFKRAFSAATVHDFFNILAVLILFPLERFFGIFEKSAIFLGNLFFTEINEKPFESPIKAAVKWGASIIKDLSMDMDWLYLLLSGALTVAMLFSIVKLLKGMVISKVENFFGRYIFKTAIRAMAFGMVLTILVQSSSITTSTIVPLAGAGVLTLRQIFPFTLGANIGTTITAMMASLTLNPIAMVAAFSHLLFNITGIVIIYPIRFLRNIPLNLAEKISEMTEKNRLVPIFYLAIMFIAVPLIFILIGS